MPTPRLILGGLGALLAGYLLFLRVAPGMPYVEFLLPTMLCIGLGFALTFPAVNAQATQGIADDEQGLAAGLVNTSLQIGGAVVLAVTSAILGGGHVRVTHDALLPDMTTAVALVAGVAVAGLLVTAVRLVAVRRTEVATAEACETG